MSRKPRRRRSTSKGPPWSRFAQRTCRGAGAPAALVGPAEPQPDTYEVCHPKHPDRCVRLDRQDGAGNVGANYNVDYLGATVMLRPSDFRALTPERLEDPEEQGLCDFIRSGGTIANPVLFIESHEEKGVAKVSAHEGRGRMMCLRKIVGDVPVPVHLVVRQTFWGIGGFSMRPRWTSGETRARHWTGGIVDSLRCVVPEKGWGGAPKLKPPARGLFRDVVVHGQRWRRDD